MLADSATLKLDNQKNGWKVVCVHQHANGRKFVCIVRAIGCRYCYIRQASDGDCKIWLSEYWDNSKNCCDITNKDIRRNVKFAAMELNYFGTRGIPVYNVDTHLLHSGGAMALALSGYADTQIHKMGRWKGALFKEYIHEDLACDSEGMSKDTKRSFGFVNIEAGANRDVLVYVTNNMMITDYNTRASVEAYERKSIEWHERLGILSYG